VIPGYPALNALRTFQSRASSRALGVLRSEALLSSEEVLAAVRTFGSQVAGSAAISSDGSIDHSPSQNRLPAQGSADKGPSGRILLREDDGNSSIATRSAILFRP